ncbi:helix-turn-helix domain-containing protein [Rossellomorea aquimaris]|uniref:Helix-turn-helix protein n=1 Tax=Rossellomorea aquimaris TaxID=189382 RepID=A0A366EM41_9BACI|nr:helix-turn-helix domain-containing protein [Rossellomorea aquimaris]RBP02515.1 helix-turn-helix protein [Rossellomorea aquimaris]
MIMTIGQSLRDLRTYQKISQKKLAKGICTQAYISMIEKGVIVPSAHILYSLAIRLGVSINYFLDTPDSTVHEYQVEFINQARAAAKSNDYGVLRKLIHEQRSSPLFKTTKMKKFTEYHLGVCQYHLDSDLHGAMKTLKDTLSDNNEHYFQEDVETLIAMANILTEENLLDEAERYYHKALYLLESRPSCNDYSLRLKFYYNYQRFLKNQEKYDQVVEIASKGIKICVQNDTLYLRGEFYYYKGISFIRLNRVTEGIEALQKAILIFSLSGKEHFIEAAQSTIDNALFSQT